MFGRTGMPEGNVRASRHSISSRFRLGQARKEVRLGERKAWFSHENKEGRLGFRIFLLPQSKVEAGFLGLGKTLAASQGAIAGHDGRTRGGVNANGRSQGPGVSHPGEENGWDSRKGSCAAGRIARSAAAFPSGGAIRGRWRISR